MYSVVEQAHGSPASLPPSLPQAVDAFKAGDFMEALNGFTHALALGKDLGGVSAQQKTILSNRSACYEK